MKKKLKNEATTGTRLWIVLARTYAAMASYVEASVGAEELGISDFMTLEVLLHKGPMAMSAIGEKVLLANASMTAAVDRLEKRKLVLRRNSEGDRRIRMVELTDEGRVLIEGVYERHARGIEGVVGVLDEAEQGALRASLKKLGFAARAAAEQAKSAQQASPKRERGGNEGA